MNPRFYGIIFRRQSERVKAHRVQNIIPVHTQKTAVNVRGGIAFRVPHMKPVARRIRKHIQYVGAPVFRKTGILGRLKSLIFFPIFLPFFFYFAERIRRHCLLLEYINLQVQIRGE